MHKRFVAFRVLAALALALTLVAGLLGINAPRQASAGVVDPITVISVDLCLSLAAAGLLNADGTVVAGVTVEDVIAEGVGATLAGQIVIEGACTALLPVDPVDPVDPPVDPVDPPVDPITVISVDLCLSLAAAGLLNADGTVVAGVTVEDVIAEGVGATLAGQIVIEGACTALLPVDPVDPVDPPVDPITVISVDLCLSLAAAGLLNADGTVVAGVTVEDVIAEGVGATLAGQIVIEGACADLIPAPSASASAIPSTAPPVVDISVDLCVRLISAGLLNADGTVALGVTVDDVIAVGVGSVLAGQIVIEGACADLIPAPSASASASASAAPSFPGEVVEDAVVITGALQEDDDRDGDYDYFLNSVSATAEGDIRLAGAGEQTYSVAFFEGDTLVIVDSGSTDVNGMVVLNAPADEDYFIFEENDFNDPFGSGTVPAGEPSNWFVIEYVDDLDGDGSASPSASDDDGSVGGSARPSGDGDGDGDGNGNGDGDGTDRPGRANSGAAGGNAGSGATTSLPNTGAGGSEMGPSMTWVLVALMAVAGVLAAGIGLHRRTT